MGSSPSLTMPTNAPQPNIQTPKIQTPKFQTPKAILTTHNRTVSMESKDFKDPWWHIEKTLKYLISVIPSETIPGIKKASEVMRNLCKPVSFDLEREREKGYMRERI
jgi:hypothetical protein